jgi:hypothetical protein
MAREGARERGGRFTFIAGAPMRPGKCQPHRAQIVALADRAQECAPFVVPYPQQHHGERKRETVLPRRETMRAIEPAPREREIAARARRLAFLEGGLRARNVSIGRGGVPNGHALPILPQHDTARELPSPTFERG